MDDLVDIMLLWLLQTPPAPDSRAQKKRLAALESDTLFEYFKRYPGKRETLALTAHGSNGVPWPDLRLVCHLTATELGLDPARLVPHSLRVGAQAQIEMHSDERRLQQGGWNTMGGMKVYARKALGNAKAIADALHDPSICPIEQTRMLFNDHSVVNAPVVHHGKQTQGNSEGGGQCLLC